MDEIDKYLKYARNKKNLFEIADNLGQQKAAIQHLLSACTAYEVAVGELLDKIKKMEERK